MKIGNIKIRNTSNRARPSIVYIDRKKEASKKACRVFRG